jgi:hypothetical protein
MSGNGVDIAAACLLFRDVADTVIRRVERCNAMDRRLDQAIPAADRQCSR